MGLPQDHRVHFTDLHDAMTSMRFHGKPLPQVHAPFCLPLGMHHLTLPTLYLLLVLLLCPSCLTTSFHAGMMCQECARRDWGGIEGLKRSQIEQETNAATALLSYIVRVAVEFHVDKEGGVVCGPGHVRGAAAGDQLGGHEAHDGSGSATGQRAARP